jgi:hypothetical protein
MEQAMNTILKTTILAGGLTAGLMGTANAQIGVPYLPWENYPPSNISSSPIGMPYFAWEYYPPSGISSSPYEHRSAAMMYPRHHIAKHKLHRHEPERVY